jgi:hypothetical protein
VGTSYDRIARISVDPHFTVVAKMRKAFLAGFTPQ